VVGARGRARTARQEVRGRQHGQGVAERSDSFWCLTSLAFMHLVSQTRISGCTASRSDDCVYAFLCGWNIFAFRFM
jgi:hypothetical protein